MNTASPPLQIRAPGFSMADFVSRRLGFVTELEIQASEF
jgi:hypothetical protein